MSPLSMATDSLHLDVSGMDSVVVESDGRIALGPGANFDDICTTNAHARVYSHVHM